MKVQAIITGFDLTEGKIYDVIMEYDSVYELKCDTGTYCRNKDFFKIFPDKTVPEMQKFEDCDCDVLKPWCRVEGPAMTHTPSGISSCEGEYCQEAYDKMIEDIAIKCDVCQRLVSVEDGTTVTDTSDGSQIFVCDDCDIPDNGDHK